MNNTHSHLLLIAGGGTGGHVVPGIAVAEAWKKQFPEGRVVFVGSFGGIEEKLVPRAGFQLELLQIGALKGKSWKAQLKTLLQLPFAFWFSAFILLRLRPQAVLGVGGYSSGPVVLLARGLGWMWGARVAILEQNAVPGFTNKILGIFAHQVFAALLGIERHFPSGKTVVTGNPVRKEIKLLPSATRSPFTVFIFGGSQGALGINSLVLEALPLLQDLKEKVRFIHQTGERDFERVIAGYGALGFEGRIEKYIDDIVSVYAEASLLICRAGSSTLSEIAAVGRGAILIPFPHATDNHQEKNAELLREEGAALVLNQMQATGSNLAELIRNFVLNPEHLSGMEKSVQKFFKTGAAKAIVEKLINRTAAC